MIGQFLISAFGNDRATMNPCTWANINDMVSCTDRIFIMLDHQYGIAQIT